MINERFELVKIPYFYGNEYLEQEMELISEYKLIMYTILNSLVDDAKKFTIYIISCENNNSKIIYEVPNNLYFNEILKEYKYYKFIPYKGDIVYDKTYINKVFRKIISYPVKKNLLLYANTTTFKPICPFGDENENTNYILPFILTLLKDCRHDKWHNILYILKVVQKSCIKITIESGMGLVNYVPYINKCIIKFNDCYKMNDDKEVSELYHDILLGKNIFHVNIDIFSDRINVNKRLFQAILADWGINSFALINDILKNANEIQKALLTEIQSSFTLNEVVDFLILPYLKNKTIDYYNFFIPKPFNMSNINETDEVRFANIINDNFINLGRLSNEKLLNVSPQILKQHLFICGTTGSGKTTLIKRLLKELPNDVHYLVIDPIKDDYDNLVKNNKKAKVINFTNNTFEINPFAVPLGVDINTHASLIARVFSTIIPMTQSGFDYFLGIIKETYRRKAGNLYSDKLFNDKKITYFYEKYNEALPSFNDLFSLGYKWLHEVLRLELNTKSITLADREASRYFEKWEDRIKVSHPLIYNTFNSSRNNISFNQLVDSYNIVIDLFEFSDLNEKKAMMLFFVGIINEIRRGQGSSEKLKHVVVLEEAHLIMPASSRGSTDNMVSSVDFEMCNIVSNLLAEIRSFGEGLIIAEQSPSKIISDALINTSTKIIKRLIYGRDIDYLADAIGIDENEKKYLLSLAKNESIIFLAGTSRPIIVYNN